MPYRVDIPRASDAAADRLIELGALDIERTHGSLAALMPDSIPLEQVSHALGLAGIAVSDAVGRDEGSVWVLSPRSIETRRLRIVPAYLDADSDALKLLDTTAFGTGLHPTTALCLDALDDILEIARPDRVLDVGTGSGILALAALKLGAPRAHGIDTDEEALRIASENARINALDDRLHLTHGGPESLDGAWPLVLANVLAAPLIDMAPALVRRIAHRGELVLSGIPDTMARDVANAYRRLGMNHVRTTSRGGWVAMALRATW
jgi:ribosomal protein L11 methyltransferase